MKMLKFKFQILLIALFFVASPVFAVSDYHFPRIANYFLKWQINDGEAAQLARWDLLVLDMEAGINSSAQINKIRRLNPDILILAYITPQEILDNAGSSVSSLRRKLSAQIPEAWYLKNLSGNKISYWPGTSMLNLTGNCPPANGTQFNEFLAKFVNSEVLSSGLWDGVFYDNAWENLTGFAGSGVDTDNNGIADSNPDLAWRAGLNKLYSETRRLFSNKNYLILGNATTDLYREALNGNMTEGFPHGDWAGRMAIYKSNEASGTQPRVNIINSNTGNTGNGADYKNIRFGLSNTLLLNGYFSFDYGNQDHGQTWWYDEYNVNLGAPTGNARSAQNKTSFQPDIWRRDFNNGLVLVNSTGEQQKIDLGGEYEKIHGTQDTNVNNGSIITQTTLDSYDGLLLLKTFSTVNDALFRNGDFLRFFSPNGERARNGFFVFEAGYKGGDKIARLDLDGNGRRDLLVVSKNKLLAWRDDGQPYMKIYPYGVNYQGELRVAIGDLNQDGYLEVYVAPSPGYPAPIKVYTRHGRQMKNDWYPLGEKYSGGYNLSVGDVDKAGKGELLIATGNGTEPRVRVYDYGYNEIFNWLAWEKQFRGGISIATGDVNGDGLDEVVVGAGPGKKPIIRIFDQFGKQLYKEFTAYSSLGNPGIDVQTADVNYDGKDEIIGMGL